MGPKGEALAWGLRKAWYAAGNNEYSMLKFVRENVQKHDGSMPRTDALRDLFAKIDDDEEWYPGKLGGAGSGGRPRRTPAARRAAQRRVAAAA